MLIIPKLMRMDIAEWEIPLEVDVGIGDNWAQCVSYSYNEETKGFTPKGKYVTKQ